MQTSAYLMVVWDISATRGMPQDMAGFLEVFWVGWGLDQAGPVEHVPAHARELE